MSNDTLRRSTRRRRPTQRQVIFERAPRRRRGDGPEVIVLVDEGSDEDEDENIEIPVQDLEEARQPVQTVQESLVTIHGVDGMIIIRIHSMAVQFGMFDEYILDI